MEKRKAILVHIFNSRALSPDWTPTISREELEEANENLENDLNLYRWRWVDLEEDVVNLTGAVCLHAEAINVAA
jgi:hypothetical protein